VRQRFLLPLSNRKGHYGRGLTEHMYDLAIKNGLCFIDREFVECNIGINGNKIAYVGKSDIRGEIEINAANMFVLPGLFNAHTHAAMTLFRGYAEGLPLRQWLEKVWEVEAKLNEDAVYWGSMLACLEMLKSGVTAFADMYIHMDGVAEAVGETGIRAIIGYGMADRGNVERAEKELEIALEVISKWNGSFGGRLRCMLTPHAPYTCSPEFLRRIAEIGREKNLVKHIHLSETLWEVREIKKQFGVRPAELLDSLGFLDDKTVVAHAVWLSDEEISVLAKKGVSVAHCPTSNLKLSSGVARVTEMIESGINLSIGTDGAASNNMLCVMSEVRTAALLQSLRRKVVRTSDWLRAATENGYRAYGFKGGRISTGMLADVTIFQKNFRHYPLHDPASLIFVENCEAYHVIVNGELIVEEGIVLPLDEEKVLKKVENVKERLFGHG